MDINKTNGLKLWDERIGKTIQKAFDFSNREIHRGLYGVTDSDKGWNIDHIMPKSLGGSDEKDNLEIVNHITNSEKGDNITFVANNKKFQVQKNKNGKYEIVEIGSKQTNEDKDYLSLFKRDIVDGKDFSGRSVKQSEFETDSEYAWTIGYYTNKIAISNAYAAHKDTVKEQLNKTSFKANGSDYKLRKIEGRYYFINQSKIEDNDNYYSVLAVSDRVIDTDSNLYKDVISINLDNYDEGWLSKIVIIYENIVKSYDLNYNLVLKTDRMDTYLHFIFDTPNKEDSCTVHQVAMYFNSMKHYFKEKGYENDFITIFHWCNSFSSSKIIDFYNRVHEFFIDISPRYYFDKYTLYVESEVTNYLRECNYKNDSFTSTSDTNWFERNYIYTDLINSVKKYIK
jgi:hypothetical protein